ncbi:MAG: carbon-nitrogen hydrolase family protein [Fimbriimonadaceae bacterium]
MKLACVQMNVAFGDWQANIAKVVSQLEKLAEGRVDLAVFPECALTGYCIEDSWEAADAIALGCPGHHDGPLREDQTMPIQKACSKLGIAAIVGYAWNNGMDCLNAATFFRADEGPEHYYKSHLPELGLDKHVMSGCELPVFDTEWGRIGILICYDQRLPEPARVLALKGADLIVLPTNWPEGAETSAEHVCITRAAENHVFYAACNRVGTENGFTFIGRSKIIGPTGKVLAAAGSEEETIYSDIDMVEARSKRIVVIPGQYELPVFGARRPELYGIIAEPSD